MHIIVFVRLFFEFAVARLEVLFMERKKLSFVYTVHVETRLNQSYGLFAIIKELYVSKSKYMLCRLSLDLVSGILDVSY